MPRLPRLWYRDSVNQLATRDGTLALGPFIPPGVTVERVRFHYRIYGRTNESDIDVPFDAYYVGIALAERFYDPLNLQAWGDRNSVDWMWWEGAHFKPVMQTGSPGQSWLFYPETDSERDCKAKRTYNGLDQGQVIFSYGRSGGSVLTDQRVNVVASILTLG